VPAPSLPYSTIAGVVPLPHGWLVASARTQGTVTRTQAPGVVDALAEVVDARPNFDAIAVFAPIGVLDEPSRGGRACDHAARELLGPARGRAVAAAPARNQLQTPRHRHAAEVNDLIQPYMQRTVHEVHPELTFFQLNGEQPARYGPATASGIAERRGLLGERLEGLDRVLDADLRGVTPARALNAAAALWTARRVFGRAAVRVPLEAEWDSRGLRMAIAY
jgi:predicted RNase H-like nuclease